MFRRNTAAVVAALNRIEATLMSGLSDLQANLTGLAQALTTALADELKVLADIAAALQNGDSDTAVEAAAQLVAQRTEQVQQLQAGLDAADPGAPPVTSAAPVTTASTSTSTS
jgi:predicted transcriptional regulator